ncbi:MAG: ribonuclease HI [Candidatus Hydrogenedentes bacterium]|nr:ribonuclease HI [Candidatus Hydrogenedentota bacterium]
MTTNGRTVTIYTDGGCVPNPGVGGWGAVLVYGDITKELSGGEPQTTNNRMELTAAVRALESLKRTCRVVVYTDSQYLQKGITAWLPAWKRNGWQRKRGGLKNVDLWQQLDALIARHDVEWRWIRGHSGEWFNERCDELAGEAIARLSGPKKRATER